MTMSIFRKHSNVSEYEERATSAQETSAVEPMLGDFHPFAKIKRRFSSFGSGKFFADIDEREDLSPSEKRQTIIGAIISAAVVVFAVTYLMWRVSLGG